MRIIIIKKRGRKKKRKEKKGEKKREKKGRKKREKKKGEKRKKKKKEKKKRKKKGEKRKKKKERKKEKQDDRTETQPSFQALPKTLSSYLFLQVLLQSKNENDQIIKVKEESRNYPHMMALKDEQEVTIMLREEKGFLAIMSTKKKRKNHG